MKRLYPILVLVAAACSSTETSTPEPDGGTPVSDAGNPIDDSGNPITDAGSDAGRETPVFLDTTAYADLLTIDPAFPFGVTQVHAADDKIGGAHWGRHGGPMVTTGVYGADAGAASAVEQWSIGATAIAAATRTEKVLTKANGLPAMFFYGADGVVDLPFGSLSLLDYTGSGAQAPGEALLYDATYTTVSSRAYVNGFYSGVGIDGTTPTLVYAGLSGVSTATSATSDNGLYGAPVCNGKLAETTTGCASWKIFGWTGNSGPVVTDAHDNVFVAGSLGATNGLYAITKAQIVQGQTVTQATIAETSTAGTSSFAAVAPENGGHGWVLGLGFGENDIYAYDYTDGAAIAKGTATIAKAISGATGIDSMTVFTDSEGDLWVALTKTGGGAFVELRRKP